jgi:thiamine-monophosphate kinase
MSPSATWRGSKGTPVSTVGEFGLIARLDDLVAEGARRHRLASDCVALGIGDDAASLRPSPGHELLVTCDIQVEGRHFDPAWISPHALGERCATINLSDIAAMGGIPRAAVVSLGLGPDSAVEDIEDLYRGMVDRLAEYGALLIGGNVSGLSSGLIVDVTLIGEVESGRAVRRDGARPGDLVWVTGSPGSACAGLELLRSGVRPSQQPQWASLIAAYLAPVPRVPEGRALAATGVVSAMIDTSDGLIGDLHHLVERQQVGILLREESLPIGEALGEAAIKLGRSPLSLLLGASDDYELLFTVAAGSAEQTVRALEETSKVAVWPIGEVIADAPGQILLEDRRGSRRPALAGGWDHFRSA